MIFYRNSTSLIQIFLCSWPSQILIFYWYKTHQTPELSALPEFKLLMSKTITPSFGQSPPCSPREFPGGIPQLDRNLDLPQTQPQLSHSCREFWYFSLAKMLVPQSQKFNLESKEHLEKMEVFNINYFFRAHTTLKITFHFKALLHPSL